MKAAQVDGDSANPRHEEGATAQASTFCETMLATFGPAKGAIVRDGKRHTLTEWLKAKNMTPRQLMNARAGVSEDVIRRWVQTGRMPIEVEANGRSLNIALALGVPPELFDAGPNYRGFTEAGHQFFLRTRGRDDLGWEAHIDALKLQADAPEGSPPIPVFDRVKGPTAKASRDALEQQLRDVIRTNQRVENEERGEP